ncbi:MAG: alpha/beta hydrolase [Ornithinimicrobium sp.]|jgi:S-formylglutathione hydrolase FrmB|uniref:alpha/beta hydrolase n=1 Tax=Ornithinimicrobium sp. TaxID=1977084 RepID=UPI00184CFEBE|nr:esterase family protein [Actinomycetota bacterium]
MALITCDFYSDVLEVSTSMTVLLPQQTRTQIGMSGAPGHGEPPVLYLLHGLSDDHTTWVRRTSIERYAAPLGLAVVMPAVHRSFYADEVHGHRYWTFLSQELSQVVSSFFRVSQRQEDTYVAGLSMGGYGALKWALREPDRFAGVASMSGALDVVRMPERPERAGLVERVFGGMPGPQDDVLALVASADVEALPPVHLSCGTDDELVEGNRVFARAAREAGVQLTEDFRPGEHEWGFWDTEIQSVLDWLPGLST